jgi:hypothetical protein
VDYRPRTNAVTLSDMGHTKGRTLMGEIEKGNIKLECG